MASAMAATCGGAIDFVKPGSGAVEVSGGRPIVGHREIRGVEIGYCNRWVTGEIPSQCRPGAGIDEPLAGGPRGSSYTAISMGHRNLALQKRSPRCKKMPTRLASAAHQACAETFGAGSAI